MTLRFLTLIALCAASAFVLGSPGAQAVTNVPSAADVRPASSALATTTNVVPNPGFEQAGCSEATPVICGWVSSKIFRDTTNPHSGTASMRLETCVGNCNQDDSWHGASASTDPAFCAVIGPGAHPASVWYAASWARVGLFATFYEGPDCSGAASYDWLAQWATGESPELRGHLVAPPGTQSALFSVSVGQYGSYPNVIFDDLDVESAVEIDSAPPETTITSFTDDTGDGAIVTVEFDASEAATFECSLDGAAFAACQSSVSYGPLEDGPHAVRVRAIDRVGNVDPSPAEQAWTVAGAFSLSASPDSLSLAAGTVGTFAIHTAGALPQTVSLSTVGEPAGTGVSFSPPSVVVGSSSTMTVRVPSGAVPEVYTITVKGIGTLGVHATTVTLTVTASNFSISSTPASMTVVQGSSGTSSITTAITSGAAQTVVLSAAGQPTATSVNFAPASVSAGGTTTMTVSVGSTTAPGTYTITVTGTGVSATHTTTVALTVTAPAGPVVNGGFETGTFTWWTSSSAGDAPPPTITTTAHGGAYAARIGGMSAFTGDSRLQQTVTVPAGSPQLRFWYQPNCANVGGKIDMQIRTISGTTLAKVVTGCPKATAWTSVSYTMAAYTGQTVVLWWQAHGQGGRPVSLLLDDVTLG